MIVLPILVTLVLMSTPLSDGAIYMNVGWQVLRFSVTLLHTSLSALQQVVAAMGGVVKPWLPLLRGTASVAAEATRSAAPVAHSAAVAARSGGYWRKLILKVPLSPPPHLLLCLLPPFSSRKGKTYVCCGILMMIKQEYIMHVIKLNKPGRT
jgi:hypothetical protein